MPDDFDDQIVFDLPTGLQNRPYVRLAVNVLKQAIEDVAAVISKKRNSRVGAGQAAIALAWLEGRAKSRLTFGDVAAACDCDVQRLRDLVFRQFDADGLDSIRWHSVYRAITRQDHAGETVAA